MTSSEILPFRVEIDDSALLDLRNRLRHTRWPETETVQDWSQGVPLEYLRELCHYWAEDYDWRARETRLNALPQFRTDIDGLGIHFLHIRSPHPHALPLVMTHGWPGSVVEFLGVIGPLTDPVAHGGSATDAFDVVCPSLPGYGFSDKPTQPGWNVEQIARAWSELMARLGYDRYGAQGHDWERASAPASRNKIPTMLSASTSYRPWPRPTRRRSTASPTRSGGRSPTWSEPGNRRTATPSSSRPSRKPSATAWSIHRPRCAHGSSRNFARGPTATDTRRTPSPATNSWTT